MDEDLRELRRAVAAHPGEPDRLRALAAAQERAGDRRGAFLSWCALARTGDRAAQERVLGWSPWPSGGGLGGAHRARRAGITGPPRLEWREQAPHGGWLWLATDALALGEDRAGAPSALGPDLAPAWAFRGDASHAAFTPASALCGDDLVWCAGERLYLLDAARGTLRAEAPLAPELGGGLAARGDRLVLLGRGEEAPLAACLDLGRDFGRVVWPGPDEAPDEEPGEFQGLRPAAPPRGAAHEVAIGGAWAWLTVGDESDPFGSLATGVAALRVETGVPYRLPGLLGPLDPRALRGWSLLGADEEGALLAAHPDGGDAVVYEVEARTGALRWARRVERLGLRPWASGGGALGADVVALAGFASEGRALRLDVLDRVDGRPRWGADFPLQGEWPPHQFGVALVDGALYFAWTAPRPTFLAWEPRSGRELWRAELPREVEAPARLDLIPRAGELLFEVQGADACLRGRLFA